ncbi:MAG: 1,6-anhydro-N-acetylmuramyl-L-alanine amidase AmpD [Burkholderiales bacterium]|nr:1,6-anhydro-N-acetylmuramyl-L-alanine amidase AmpD [Burkholderiales bacterium]
MALQPVQIGPDGWADRVERAASPNFDGRPAGAQVELLVVHNISLPPGCFGSGAIERLFRNAPQPRRHPFLDLLAGLRVSAHFLIERDGRTTQFVSCARRAWHAGDSTFEGRAGCNDFSIGVELEGTDFTGFEAEQYSALAQLTRALRAAYPLRAVRGHSQVAAGRKTDPGPLFDWRRFAEQADLPMSWLP